MMIAIMLSTIAHGTTYEVFVENKTKLFANHKILIHNVNAFNVLLMNTNPPLSEEDMQTVMLASSYTETTDKAISRILGFYTMLYTLHDVEPNLLIDAKAIINNSDLDGIDTMRLMKERFKTLSDMVSDQKCKEFIENNILNIDQAIASIKIMNEYLNRK